MTYGQNDRVREAVGYRNAPEDVKKIIVALKIFFLVNCDSDRQTDRPTDG